MKGRDVIRKCHGVPCSPSSYISLHGPSRKREVLWGFCWMASHQGETAHPRNMWALQSKAWPPTPSFLDSNFNDAGSSVGRGVVVGIVLVALMVKRDAVELFEGIDHLTTGRGQTTIQRHALHRPGSTQVHALTLLHVAEVDGINATALVRNDRGLHVSNQSPLGSSEEGMHLDIRSSSASAQATVLIFDEQLANQGLAETRRLLTKSKNAHTQSQEWTHFDICGAPAWSGKGMSSLKMFAKVAFRFLPLNGVVP